MKYVIFTDLDGTLLDYKYSYKKALPTLNLIKRLKIPLILCTSKSTAETEFYAKKLKLKHPFIVQNGGAIFIPKNYFKSKFRYKRKTKSYYIIELGTHYKRLIKAVKDIRKKGFDIKGFNDVSAKEISKELGLPLKQAKLAKKRGYDEPIMIRKRDEKKIVSLVKKMGLNYIRGGQFGHITGKNDKGKAVKTLINLYKKQNKKIKTIALGDSENDFDMLKAVNKGFLVQRRDKSYASNKFNKAKGVGPKGWNKVIREMLK